MTRYGYRMTTLATRVVPSWQRSIQQGISSVGALLDALELSADEVDASLVAQRDFPLRVPRAFVARMRCGDGRDPLLRQVLPIGAETARVSGFDIDPLRESAVSPSRGVLRKFQDRALLVVTGACAVHCRYCFRRHFPYAEHGAWGSAWDDALAAIRDDPAITEVILSGGDPLSVRDDGLKTLADALATIPHVTRLRIHTRLPIVLPERVDDDLLAWLCGSRLTPVMVVHANHANEIDADVRAALARLRAADVLLLNQSVILRGVNDDVAVLVELSEALFAAGVMPYYLHVLDPVAGAAHFQVPDDEASALVAAMMRRLPGYLVPRLVREVPGAPAKVPVPVDPRQGA